MLKCPVVNYVEDKNFYNVTASHNGYEKKFGLIHTRSIKILKEKDKIFAYDQLLFENVPNYKRFTNKNNISINGKKINQYYKEKKKDVFLNIGYVKKMGFLNVPILSIL